MALFKRLIASLLIVPFMATTTPYAFAAELAPWMPQAGTMVSLSAKFEPALMVGIQLDAKDPFRFNFLIERGQKELTLDVKREEYRKLIKYFLASLTIPNDDMWVNLSPYEHERIIPDNFGLTEMGRDLLAQDYLLKQITSSLIHPDEGAAKGFWKKVYEKAYEKYGTTDIPLDTFNKVWIVPDTATIFHRYDTALIVENHLKVMMEQDYLALEKNQGQQQVVSSQEKPSSETAKLAAEVVREIVIPMLEKEVNEGEHFAPLRQVYSAMLMATWFKKTLRESVLGQVYADKSKVVGVELNNPNEKEEIYQQYLKAYKIGVFNFIKEDLDPLTQEVIPRKYFSGGTKSYDLAQINEVDSSSRMTLSQRSNAGKLSESGIDKTAVIFDATRRNNDGSIKIMNGNDGNFEPPTKGPLVANDGEFESGNRFGADNNGKIPKVVLDAMNRHPTADVQAELAGRLEALRLKGIKVRKDAQVQAADWARAALRNPLIIPDFVHQTIRFDPERGRDIRVNRVIQDEAAGRFDPARGVIALRENADQFVEFHEAAEMVMRIFKFRSYLKEHGVDANNSTQLIEHARAQGMNVVSAQEALEKLMAKFFAENVDLVDALHNRAKAWEERFREKAWKAEQARLDRHDRVPTMQESKQPSIHNRLTEVISRSVEGLALAPDVVSQEVVSQLENKNLKDADAIKRVDFNRFETIKVVEETLFVEPLSELHWLPNIDEESVVLASLRLFKDVETGELRWMDTKARRIDENLQRLIEKFGIEVKAIPNDEWDNQDIISMEINGRKVEMRIAKEGLFGNDDGLAAARAEGDNRILLPENMPQPRKVRDKIIAHEIGHNLDFRLGLREFLAQEPDGVLAAVMELGEGRLRQGQASLRDAQGNLRINEFRQILFTEDFGGKEILAEAFANAWANPNRNNLGVQFFQEMIPEAFEGRVKSSIKNEGPMELTNAPAHFGANIGKEQTKGGIDFDVGLLSMKIKRDGEGMPLPLPMQDPVLMHIEGLSPTILEIAPANAMPIFADLQKT